MVILHAPQLLDTSADMQDEVDEILTRINREGAECVLYNLSFAKLFDNWEQIRKEKFK